MERFVDENYTYLNGNVEAMGQILRKFNETFRDVKGLRQQVGREGGKEGGREGEGLMTVDYAESMRAREKAAMKYT